MDAAWVIKEVCGRSGVDATEAERVIVATLESLAERLLDIDAKAIAARLPPVWAQHLARGGNQEFDIDGLYTRVSERTGLWLEEALELTQVVCQAFSGALDSIGRQHLLLHLPGPWHVLFTPRVRSV